MGAGFPHEPLGLFLLALDLPERLATELGEQVVLAPSNLGDGLATKLDYDLGRSADRVQLRGPLLPALWLRGPIILDGLRTSLAMCLTQRLGARLILLDPLTLEVLELVHRIGEARQQAMVFAAAVGEVRCQRSLSRQPPAIEPVRPAPPPPRTSSFLPTSSGRWRRVIRGGCSGFTVVPHLVTSRRPNSGPRAREQPLGSAFARASDDQNRPVAVRDQLPRHAPEQARAQPRDPV
jgi:hypothetical protein